MTPRWRFNRRSNNYIPGNRLRDVIAAIPPPGLPKCLTCRTALPHPHFTLSSSYPFGCLERQFPGCFKGGDRGVRAEERPTLRFERIVTRVATRGEGREFLGFNRARHAVLEGTILATRLHLIPADEVSEQFARLAIPVEKTAGPREREAWSWLTEFVRARGVSVSATA